MFIQVLKTMPCALMFSKPGHVKSGSPNHTSHVRSGSPDHAIVTRFLKACHVHSSSLNHAMYTEVRKPCCMHSSSPNHEYRIDLQNTIQSIYCIYIIKKKDLFPADKNLGSRAAKPCQELNWRKGEKYQIPETPSLAGSKGLSLKCDDHDRLSGRLAVFLSLDFFLVVFFLLHFFCNHFTPNRCTVKRFQWAYVI